MRTLIASIIRNRVFATIVLVTFVFAGVLASRQMVRETFPKFSEDRITISVAYPGADPEEVEEGISRKIEEALEDVEGIKEFGTESRENIGAADILVKKGFNTREVLDRVRSKIDTISTFPVDAERPVVEEVLIEEPVVMLALAADMSEQRLKEWAQVIKDELRMLPDVSQVNVFGVRDYEIAIELSEERLREYDLTFEEVAKAVRRNSVTLAGGILRTEGEDIRIRTLGRRYTGAEMASIIVMAEPDGDVVTLERLGDIRDGFTEDPAFATVNGRRAVFVNVMKTGDEDALKISRAVHRFIERKRAELPDSVQLLPVSDSSDMLNARIRLLVRNGLIGLTFVFLLLWLFLDFRLSFWAGMGMPISICGALVVLWAVGGTLNMISLFGLIMVLGIIVDDAIVVGEAIYVHRRKGESSVDAALNGLGEVGLPVFAAVITTIVAFIPLGFVGGIMGKFIAILPVVVIACLLVSLVECLFLLPAHLAHAPDDNGDEKEADVGRVKQWGRRFHRRTSGALEWFVERAYGPFLTFALRWRYAALCVAISVLMVTMGLVKGGILKFVLFPSIDGFVITATVEYPDGTPSETTHAALLHMDASFKRAIEGRETVSGESPLRYSIVLVGQTLTGGFERGPNVGSVQIILLDSEKRGIPSSELLVAWERETGRIPGVEALTFQDMDVGPPGADIEFWMSGDNIESTVKASEAMKSRLEQFDGVYQVRSDYRPGKTELRLRLKPEARSLGLNVGDLAEQINAGYFGVEAMRIQRGRDDIRVRIRYVEDERRSVADLQQIRIRTARGDGIPLMSVANIEVGAGFTQISRKNGMRNIAVSAAVDLERANSAEIVDELSGAFFAELAESYPDVYVSIRGEKKRSEESLGSLKIGFPLAMVGIFVIVATMFHSYAQTVIVLLTVPFGIVGAFFGHLLMGRDLSMMSMFGIVALAGVVVNDAIVLIESINSSLARGVPFFEAIHKGGARRFRPVFLTTLSTVGGLLPLILEQDLQAQFLIPMALSIAGGVCFATVLTLLLIPSLLAILNDMRLGVYYLRHGVVPTRESVEPSSHRLAHKEKA
ncbi:MAG: multidrug efflux pump subunit AcrB [Candidatus Promineifilaceae bacterium]|jgi:multidrug efflux pump subunit AcrB